MDFKSQKTIILFIVAWVCILTIYIAFKLSNVEIIEPDNEQLQEDIMNLECNLTIAQYNARIAQEPSFCPEGKNAMNVRDEPYPDYGTTLYSMISPFILWFSIFVGLLLYLKVLKADNN